MGQLLRYMGWVKENLSREEENVHGLIIASAVDRQLLWALVCVQNISYKVYRKRGEKWEFTDPEAAVASDYLRSISPEEREKLLRMT
ncbi:hypothetical protein ACFL6G_06900 [candidate division KSB1 bacterium]